MAHRSYLSPDRKQVLVVEMDARSWLPCRLVPFDGSSPGKPVGPAPAQCTDAAWSPDGKWMYFSANTGSGVHIWRQRFPDGTPEQVTFGVTAGRRDSFRARRTLVRHVDRHRARAPCGSTIRAAIGRSRRKAIAFSSRPSLPMARSCITWCAPAERRTCDLGRPLGRGPGIGPAPAAAARFSDAALQHLGGRPARGVCRVGRRGAHSRLAGAAQWPDRAAAAQPRSMARWPTSARPAKSCSGRREGRLRSFIASRRTAADLQKMIPNADPHPVRCLAGRAMGRRAETPTQWGALDRVSGRRRSSHTDLRHVARRRRAPILMPFPYELDAGRDDSSI